MYLLYGVESVCVCLYGCLCNLLAFLWALLHDVGVIASAEASTVRSLWTCTVQYQSPAGVLNNCSFEALLPKWIICLEQWIYGDVSAMELQQYDETSGRALQLQGSPSVLDLTCAYTLPLSPSLFCLQGWSVEPAWVFLCL